MSEQGRDVIRFYPHDVRRPTTLGEARAGIELCDVQIGRIERLLAFSPKPRAVEVVLEGIIEEAETSHRHHT